MKMKNRRKDLSVYFPNNCVYGEELKNIMMFMLRIETNLKLNLVDFEGQSMIDTSDEAEVRKKEVHFLQVESVHDRRKVQVSLFWSLLLKRFTGQQDAMMFEDWMITDLDDTLRGNPIS